MIKKLILGMAAASCALTPVIAADKASSDEDTVKSTYMLSLNCGIGGIVLGATSDNEADKKSYTDKGAQFLAFSSILSKKVGRDYDADFGTASDLMMSQLEMIGKQGVQDYYTKQWTFCSKILDGLDTKK